MIIVAGTMTLDPALIPEFETAMAELRPKVLAEAGVLQYSLLVQDKAAGEIEVCERWADDAALEVHLAQPWIRALFGRFLPELKGSTVQVYDATGARPLPGL